MKKLIFLVVIFWLIYSCNQKNDEVIGYENPEIHYSGRIDTTRIDGADLYWSGTSVKINFIGQAVSALLKDENGDNYYNVIIDEDSITVLRPDTVKKYYQLAANIPDGKHSVELFKRTEWDRGRTVFYGFRIQGHPELLPGPPARKRKIEFYGNSITAAYAVEDKSGKDNPDSIYTNNYLSYAAITARHFNAEYRCICKSGIGIMISWFPLTMPEMYDRLIPDDPSSKWDFSIFIPDVVVINLFQNDSWLVDMPERTEFKEKFGTEPPDDNYIVNAYKNFVSSIRGHYPDADIICILGSMDATAEGSKWPEYIRNAVTQLNDDKIYMHFIPYKGTSGHPNVEEQRDMARSLIGFIEKNINW